MSYVFQEYPKWVRAQGVRSRIVSTEDEERAFYESLPPVRDEPKDIAPTVLSEPVTMEVEIPSVAEPAKRRGRPPKSKVPE